MKYIHAVPGTFVAFLIFIFIVIFLPKVPTFYGAEIILTVSTFLFAILGGFFISRLSSRYDSIRELVAANDAYYLSIYKNAQIFSKQTSKKISDLIDKIYIKEYDIPLHDYAYKFTATYFLKIWDEIIKIKNTKYESVYQVMLDNLTEIEKNRKTTTSLASEKLGKGQWLVLYILSGIILVSVFSLETPDLYFKIIMILFSSCLILVLLLIRDLQYLMLGGAALLFESGQEVLELMGKLRYYHQRGFKSGLNKVPASIKIYRVGIHDPKSDKFDIKIVKRK